MAALRERGMHGIMQAEESDLQNSNMKYIKKMNGLLAYYESKGLTDYLGYWSACQLTG